MLKFETLPMWLLTVSELTITSSFPPSPRGNSVVPQTEGNVEMLHWVWFKQRAAMFGCPDMCVVLVQWLFPSISLWGGTTAVFFHDVLWIQTDLSPCLCQQLFHQFHPQFPFLGGFSLWKTCKQRLSVYSDWWILHFFSVGGVLSLFFSFPSRYDFSLDLFISCNWLICFVSNLFYLERWSSSLD